MDIYFCPPPLPWKKKKKVDFTPTEHAFVRNSRPFSKLHCYTPSPYAGGMGNSFLLMLTPRGFIVYTQQSPTTTSQYPPV